MEIVELCREATAHNYGQTVFSTKIDDDGWTHVEMSSWPRAQEAVDLLTRRGYIAGHGAGDWVMAIALVDM